MSSSKKAPVLVTGGAGYIGTVLVRQLLQSGRAVRVLDNLSHGGVGLLGVWPEERFELQVGDICNRSDLSRALDGVEGIIHLAAIVGEPACDTNPELARAVNSDGSQLLCEMAIRSGVRRFVFVSTCSNYGRVPDDDSAVNEIASLQPLSTYSETKVGFENHLFERSSGNFCPVVLRFATAFGLSPRPRFDLTVNEFARDLTCGRKLKVYGKQFWRPYCHTTDLADACILALDAPTEDVKGQAFNVGDNRQNFQKEAIVNMIVDRLPKSSDLVEYVEKEHDCRNYRVSFDKISNFLGFTARKKVSDGIDEIILAINSGMIKNPFDNSYRNA